MPTAHIKHTRGPQNLSSLTAADSGIAKAAPQLLSRIHRTTTHPIYLQQPTHVAAGTLTTTAQGKTLSTAPLGLCTNDTTNPQDSFVSREGTPIDGIPPTVGGTTHPDQPWSLSGPGGPDQATDSLYRTRSHLLPYIIPTAGSNTTPCALHCSCTL